MVYTKACFGDEPHIRILKAVTVEAARAESESGDISNEALAELDAVDVIKTSGLDETLANKRLLLFPTGKLGVVNLESNENVVRIHVPSYVSE